MFGKVYDVTVEDGRIHSITGEKILVTHRQCSADSLELLKLRYRVVRVVSATPLCAERVRSFGPLD